MTRSLFLLCCLATLAFAACGPTPPVSGPKPELPQRIVLQYDFAGDWAATTGDQCAERVDLSQGVFLSVDRVEGAPDNFIVRRFFMLEDAAPAEALVGVPDQDGSLTLVVQTKGVVDGRDADIVYLLVLTPEDARYVRVSEFTMTVRDRAGKTVQADLLARAAADRTIPVISEAGERGLCLKRL